MHERDYGSSGRIGLVTPQANPTAEPEFQLLLPAHVSMLTSRCTSRGEPRQRFLDYFIRLGETLATFDTLKLDALGFACTASSYLVDEIVEADSCNELRKKFGYPVITAAAAIHEALTFLGAETIAIACPYPQWLFDIAVNYWKGRGYRITGSLSLQPEMEDTRAIYQFRGVAASSALIDAFAAVPADALVITGTGMPGLQAIIDLQQATGKPVVNSNLCLAWACCRAAEIPLGDREPTKNFPLLGGWSSGVKNL